MILKVNTDIDEETQAIILNTYSNFLKSYIRRSVKMSFFQWITYVNDEKRVILYTIKQMNKK